jgi:hypothetical protein
MGEWPILTQLVVVHLYLEARHGERAALPTEQSYAAKFRRSFL